MGCGATVILPQDQINCPDHPIMALTHYSVQLRKLLCRTCCDDHNIRKATKEFIPIANHIYSIDFKRQRTKCRDMLNSELNKVRSFGKDLPKSENTIKRQIDEYVEKMIKHLRQLKSDLYCEAEKAIAQYRSQITGRLDTIQQFKEEFKKHTVLNSFQAKVGFERVYLELINSSPLFELDTTFNADSSQACRNWEEEHDISLKASSITGDNSSKGSGFVHVGNERQLSHVSLTSISSDSDLTAVSFSSPSVSNLKFGRISQSMRKSTTTPSKIKLSHSLHLDKSKDLPGRQISDSVQLRNGMIVLCDKKNGELLLCNSSLRLLNTKSFLGNPSSIVTDKYGKIVVTSPGSKDIHHFSVRNTSIQKMSESKGLADITSVDDFLFGILDDNIVVQREGINQPWKIIDRAFPEPVSLCFDPGSRCLYVACRGKGENNGCIVKCDLGGENPLNVDFHDDSRVKVLKVGQVSKPGKMSVDDKGNLYTVDSNNSTMLIMISPNGTYEDVVLGPLDSSIENVNFMSVTDNFLVISSGGELVEIYQSSPND